MLRDGATVNRAAQALGVARSTAFRWRHRFLALPKAIQTATLVGIAGAGETGYLQSFNGLCKISTRPPCRRDGEATKRGISRQQVTVLVPSDRTGSNADAILPTDYKANVVAALGHLLPKDIILCSDGSATLAAAVKALGASRHQYVRRHSGGCGLISRPERERLRFPPKN